MKLNFEQVKGLLPQRYPYLMIDKVIKLEPGKSIVAVKNVTGNESYFLGHFPDISVMPGTSIIEAMAQAVSIIVSSYEKKKAKNKRKKPPIYYLGSLKTRFYKPVYPGDQIIIEASMDKLLKRGGYATAKVLVDKELVSTGTIVYSKR